MKNLISRAIAHINSFLNELQVKRFLAVVLVGFLLLSTNVAPESSNPAAAKIIDELVHQEPNDSQRPKTVGDWQKEARETKDAPGERLQKIVGESAEAVKDFGGLYPDTAKASAKGLEGKNP